MRGDYCYTTAMSLESCIEGVLFYKSEPVLKAELAQLFGVPDADIATAVTSLRTQLASRGIALVETDTEVQLTTAPEMSELIANIRKEDLKRDIGKAGAETLAIILYRGPLTRAEVDFIRGVNSTFVLRNLLMRGLIERIPNPNDQRSYQYTSTPALLAHLGVTHKSELPNYVEIMNELDTYEKEHHASEASSTEDVGDADDIHHE